MKKIPFLVTAVLISQVSLAEPPDKDAKAKALQSQLSPFIELMENVNGIGVAGCDFATGKITDDLKDGVSCVIIYTPTAKAANALRYFFPEGKKIKNIFVTVKNTGKFSTQ